MRRLLVALALVLFPAAIYAQSLGQVAAQERERREKKAREGKPTPARVFTNDDLKGPEGAASKEGDTAPTSQASPPRGDTPDTAPRGTREGGAIRYEPEPAPGAPGDGAPAAPRLDEDAEAAGWRERTEPARAALDQARAREASIESRISQLRQEMNPMSATYVLDPNRFLQIQEEIRNAETELAGARQETRAAQEAWDRLAEEARRAGVSTRTSSEPPR